MTSDFDLRKIVRQTLIDTHTEVVEESTRGRWTESDVTLRSGKTAKFGSKSHISDLERIVSDLERIRSRQVGGSAARAHLTSALTALRKELKKAKRRFEQTRPVSIVEE